MIDYHEIERYYLGVSMPVISRRGGKVAILGKEKPSLFYKIDDDHYADVNRKGVVAQIIREGKIVTFFYVLDEKSLRQVHHKSEILFASGPIKRRKFNPRDYTNPSNNK